MELFFKETDATVAAFICHASVEESETALFLFRKETKFFIHNSMLYNLRQMDIRKDYLVDKSEFEEINKLKQQLERYKPISDIAK